MSRLIVSFGLNRLGRGSRKGGVISGTLLCTEDDALVLTQDNKAVDMACSNENILLACESGNLLILESEDYYIDLAIS